MPTCRVTTIAIAALDEFDGVRPSTGQLLVPPTLSEHPEWNELGMRTEQTAETAEPIELAPGLELPQGRVEIRTIAPFGRLVLVRWTAELETDALKEIDWKQHWRHSWNSAEKAWPTIEAVHGLPAQDWLFSFSVVEGDAGDLGEAVMSAKSLPDLTCRLEAHGLWIGVGWDGGLFVRESSNCSTGLDAVDAIATLVSLRWQIETQAIRLIRDMLEEDHSADARDAQTARIVSISRRVYLAQTALDPSIFCVYGGDELVARAFVDGWGADKVSVRVNTAIDRLSAANELETRIHLRLSGRSQERSLILLTLIGICGTIAGVLSVVDFRNVILSSESLRFAAIGASAAVLMIASSIAQRRFGRRRRGLPTDS
jgi:hypothetical protein